MDVSFLLLSAAVIGLSVASALYGYRRGYQVGQFEAGYQKGQRDAQLESRDPLDTQEQT